MPSLGLEVTAASYFTLERRARAAIAEASGTSTDEITLSRQLDLEGEFLKAAQARQRAKDAQLKAAQQTVLTTAQLARQLISEQGLSLRDAAVILGVRHKDLRKAFLKAEALEAA